MDELITSGLAPHLRGTVEIVLAEVINNICEHAYADAPPGEVLVLYCLAPGVLTMSIEDDGAKLPNGKLPAGVPADLGGPRQNLPEGGFGWHLIRSLTTCLSYSRREGRNHLCLTFDLTAAD